MTKAQNHVLQEMADGSTLHIRWSEGRGFIYKPNGMCIGVQRRVAIAIANSGLLTKLEYDGNRRDSYSYNQKTP